jgi:hypothetical protein
MVARVGRKRSSVSAFAGGDGLAGLSSDFGCLVVRLLSLHRILQARGLFDAVSQNA